MTFCKRLREIICKMESNIIQPIVVILYHSNKLPESERALKTLAECTVKNRDMSMTSRNGCNYRFLVQLLRWATKRLLRST